MLLAVDIGVRTGLARIGRTGQVLWSRSHNLGSVARLKRAVHGILAQETGLSWLVLEGGGRLAEIWEHAGRARGLEVVAVHAQQWREAMLLPRDCRSGRQAKAVARRLAHAELTRMGRPPRTPLGSDVAEAVLLGLWAVRHLGLVPRTEETMVFGKRTLETTLPCRTCGAALVVRRLCREVRLECPACRASFDLGQYAHEIDETLEEFLATTYADRI
jgi:hypothetical protein